MAANTNDILSYLRCSEGLGFYGASGPAKRRGPVAFGSPRSLPIPYPVEAPVQAPRPRGKASCVPAAVRPGTLGRLMRRRRCRCGGSFDVFDDGRFIEDHHAPDLNSESMNFVA